MQVHDFHKWSPTGFVEVVLSLVAASGMVSADFGTYAAVFQIRDLLCPKAKTQSVPWK